MFIEVAILVALLLAYLIMKDRKPANMPPGPFEIPFFGQLPFDNEVVPMKLRKKFGDIITVRTGHLRTILLFDYKTSKDVMSSVNFADRPTFFQEFSIDDQKTGGVSSSNGIQWQHERRFTLRNLRNLGMGKSYLEDAINIEVQELVNDLKSYKEEPITYPNSLKTAPLNIIWQMVSGRRYDLRSKEVDAIYQATKEIFALPIVAFLPTFIPILKKIMPKFVRDVVFKEYIVDAFVKESENIIEKSVVEHEKNIDLDNSADLIGEYLRAMAEQGNDEKSLFRRGSLLQTISDLFIAGADTVNSMLKWTVFFLAKYPEVAAKLHQEIDEVVPVGQMVSLTDKGNLPFVEAFLMEALRYSSLVVLNLQRVATKDTTINGHFVPKGCMVVPVNYSIHHDPKYWDDPHNFSPERFIDENGKFKAPKENFIGFGSGRRQCPGETLAKMELFLFAAAIIQNFDIIVPNGVIVKNEFVCPGGLRLPIDHKLVYKPRE